MDEQAEKAKLISEKISDWIIENPKKCILSSILMILLLLPGLQYFKQKYDVRIWFRESDPSMLQLNEFERKFGNDENMVLAVSNKNGVFNKKTIELIRSITEKVWEVHQVHRVESLTNFNWTHAEGDEIIVEPLIDSDAEMSAEYLQKRKDISLAHQVIPDYLVSRDATMAMIFARLVPTFTGSPDYSKIVQETKLILNKLEKDPDIEIFLTGGAGVNDAFQEVSAEDLKILLPALYLMIAIYFFVFFRSFWAISLPFFVIGASVGTTFGICFYVGIVYNSILSILPGILTAISVADTVHVMITYFQVKAHDPDPKNAARISLYKNFIPTFLTSISTMIGFLSLTVTDLIPIKEMGFLAGLGAVIAWLLTIFFVIPVLSLVNVKIHKKFNQKEIKGGATDFSKKCVALIKQYQNTILIFFTLLTCASFYFSTQNKVNSNPFSYFDPSLPISISNETISETMGSRGGPELVIKSGKAEGIKELAFIKKVEEFKYFVDSQTYTKKSIDIISIIKEMNRSLHGDDDAYYKIPEEKNAIAEQLFLYTMSLPQGMDLNNQMSLDNEAMRMTVRWNLIDTKDWLEKLDVFMGKAKEMGLNVYVTGKSYLFHHMVDYVVATFFNSISLAMVFVSLLMMILFKSIKLGLLSLVPNVIPLLIGGAVMYFFKMDLNIGTSLVASVCLGIAVDDTIHFLSNYYMLKNKGVPTEAALAQIFTFTGRALYITSLILVLSFGMFIFGNFVPNVNFGVISSIVLSMAFIIDVVFLPALLLKIGAIRGES